jgi:hypothetical protein
MNRSETDLAVAALPAAIQTHLGNTTAAKPPPLAQLKSRQAGTRQLRPARLDRMNGIDILFFPLFVTFVTFVVNFGLRLAALRFDASSRSSASACGWMRCVFAVPFPRTPHCRQSLLLPVFSVNSVPSCLRFWLRLCRAAPPRVQGLQALVAPCRLNSNNNSAAPNQELLDSSSLMAY